MTAVRQLFTVAVSAMVGLTCSTTHALLPTASPPAAEPSPAFVAAGLLQAGLGLAVVIGLIFLLAWSARRLGLQPSGQGRLLKVVSSAMVGQRERVVVVEIGDTWLVLGVAAGQVRALHTLPAEPSLEAAATGAVPGVFSQKLVESMARLAGRTKGAE